jgi:hypothetical protein
MLIYLTPAGAPYPVGGCQEGSNEVNSFSHFVDILIVSNLVNKYLNVDIRTDCLYVYRYMCNGKSDSVLTFVFNFCFTCMTRYVKVSSLWTQNAGDVPTCLTLHTLHKFLLK